MLRPFTRSFYISLLTLTALAGHALAQSTDKNFVLSRTYKSARTVVSNNVKEASQQITYLDGLGRPLQSISAHASPQLTGTTPHDLVSHTEYDAYGRVSKVYAPSPMTGNGAYHGDAGTNSVNYYNNGSNFNQQNNRGYALTEYEASPLNRVKKQFAVGSDRAVEFNYGVNGANEIKRYDVSGNSLSESGTYGAGQLTFTQTLDENGNETKEFKDKNGRVVLKAANAGSGNWLNTYYVYDDLSQLRFVLQPQYQTAGATTDNYAFRYQYNDRGLVSSKYVPGGGTTTMTYDGRDRLTESTDGKGKTTYYKYDDLNRVIETGHKDGGTEHGLVKTYYDSYPGDSDGFLTAGGDYPGGYRSNVRGKVTFTDVRVINDDGSYGAWLGTTVYYDDRFNVIQTVRELFDLGSTDSKERVSRKLRFDGQVEKELTLQEKGSGNHSVEKIYSYDHGDRLLSTRYIVKKGLDTKKDITLAANRYDAIGQLKNKFLHATTGENNFREQLDYAYTPRSWMSKVTGKTGAGDNFGVELKYTNPVNTGAQFNGNIAEMLWRRSAGAWVGYKFVYDGANRLLNGLGIEGNTNEEVIAGYESFATPEKREHHRPEQKV